MNRTLVFSLYFIAGLITESFLFYLFPFTGLGGIICYPVCIGLCILFGWLLLKLIKRKVRKAYIISAFICFLLVQFYLQLIIHPQDFGGSPISQIADCRTALGRYEQIGFNDFGHLGRAEKVVYIFKYKDRLPKSISTLSIRRNNISNVYDLSNYANDSLAYDKNKISFSYTDSTIIIDQHPGAPDHIKTEIPFPNLLKQKGAGYYDRRDSTVYDVHEQDFGFKTGIEEMFYRYLKFFKK